MLAEWGQHMYELEANAAELAKILSKSDHVWPALGQKWPDQGEYDAPPGGGRASEAETISTVNSDGLRRPHCGPPMGLPRASCLP